MNQFGQRGSEHDFTNLLEGATKDQLQEFIDNEDKINEIICDQDRIKQIKLDKELLQAENRSIADDNISKEPLLIELRETLAAKYEQLKELNESFLMNQAKMDSLQKDVNLETVLAVMQTKCAQIEEESEEMAEKLFKGELAVNEFIAEFKAKRTVAHMRRIKTEKMRELILEAERNPQRINPPAPPIPTRIPNPGTRSTPQYPGTTQPLSYPNQYPPQARYPANAFSQPSAQQYPGYQWN